MADMEIDPAALRRLARQHIRVAAVTQARAEPATAIAAGEKPPTGKPGDKQPTDGTLGDKPPTDGKPGDKPPTDGKHGDKPGNDHTTGGPAPKPTPPPADGVGQHYGKPIELDPPPGASPALTSFVALAETAIQTTVDLLGRGITTPPPNVNDLLTTTVYQNLGKGEASDVYQQTLTKVRARQTYLLNMDAEVVKTSIKVKDGKDQTLAAVMADVNTLKDALEVDLRPLSKKLRAVKELTLMEQIADTLDSVCQKVSAVAEYNAAMAGGGNSKSGSGQGSGSGSGSDSGSGSSNGTATSGGAAQAGAGGDGGLGGLAQMLGPLAMMLPMGLMSLAPMVQQFIQNNAEQHQREEERKEREAEKAQQNGTAPNAQAAPAAPAADPNAAPAAGAAPAATAPQPGGVTADPAVITPPPANGTTPATVTPGTTPEGTSAPAVTAPSGGNIPGAPS
ncbi:hypothetical protein [Nocardia nova]|uniref:hypothetical protein n=1 Tax=Nocardia nova TaxID=37330 RepID=UPI0015E2F22B|nr:hypothetical protein [Nocardia nova]